MSKAEEIWKPIKGYEGYYEVSNLGNVRSLERDITYIVRGKKAVRHQSSVILQSKPSKTGYPIVHLSKNGRLYSCYVHRLVAFAFVVNPHEYRYINHKDEDKTNNNSSNLEWCTQKYNTTYGTAIARKCAKTRNRTGNPMPVNCYDSNHCFICTYPSMNEAKRQLGIHTYVISSLCSGIRKTPDSQGHFWKYADE
jgi:hypothetical protein